MNDLRQASPSRNNRTTRRTLRAGVWSALLLGLTTALAPSGHAQEVAKSADGFVNTIGVNTHIGWANTPYTDFPSTKAALIGLGVRHIRDGVGVLTSSPEWTADAISLAAVGVHIEAGFDGNWYPAPVGSTPLSSTDVVAQVSALYPAVETVEGPNETDLSTLFSYNGKGAFPAGSIAYAQDLYSIIKASPQTSSLPVIFGSVGNSSHFPQMTAITPGPVSYTDYGNIHSYPGGQIADNGIDWCLGYARPFSGTKPIICSETGYHNNVQYLPTYPHPGVSEAAAGKYMPAVFLEMFNRGIVRCLAYELVDQYPDPNFSDGTGEGHFGLMRVDWSPKPAYTAIADTISLLQEPGATFTPGSLSYLLSTVPGSVHHTLLEKSNGTFYLALWNDVSCYQTNTGTGGADLTNAPVAAALTFASPETVTVYSPSDASGTAPTTAYTTAQTATTVSLNIPDRVILVAIPPSKPMLPSAPTGLTAASGNGSVILTWTPVLGATSYKLYRSTTPGGEPSSATTSGITTNTYTNKKLTNGTTYYYTASAVNAAGTSARSNEASATPVALSDLIVTSITYSPLKPVVGSHVVFNAVVKNQGLGATPAGIVLGVGFGMDGSSSTTWSVSDSSPLAPGASITLTADGGVIGNYWLATLGKHVVTGWVDDVNRITETNETNNKRTQSLTVAAAPK